jgi:hypothetical protein
VCSTAGRRPSNESATRRSPTPPIASRAATATARRDPDSAASSGISASQIAAVEFMPPDAAATTVTMQVSANADSAWAAS